MTKYIYTFIVILFASVAYGKDMPQRVENKFVYDLANALKSEDLQKLETKLHKYKDSGAAEFFVVLTNNQVKENGSLFASELAKTWKLSGNSILIFTDLEKVTYGFYVGEKLKSIYPDWALEKIEHKYLRQNFRDKNYYEGLDQATSAFINIKSGAMNIEDLKKDSSNATVILLLVVFVFLLIAFPIIKFRAFRKSHFSTKGTGVYSTLILMNSYGPPAKACYDDFRKGMGRFSNPTIKKDLQQSSMGGGGVAGSW
jgi:uncharacterized protein